MSWTRRQFLRWPRLLAGSWVAAALIAACGGGGVDTGGTGAPVTAYSSGRISGFGSIVVNDVHYDESNATIVDDAGQSRSPDDLKLGMTVEVEAGDITVDSTGRSGSAASRVQFGSHISGPVESVDAAAGTLRVLGQWIDIDVNTVIEDVANGLADITTSDFVEVYAFFDPNTSRYAATRVEVAGSLSTYKLRGPISDLTAQTFSIAGAVINYAEIAVGSLPQLANGAMARVELRTTQEGGAWVATRVHTSLPGLMDRVKAELEGYIADFASLADFTVNGVRVDASSAEFRKGSVSQMVNGARIKVTGHVQDGVLLAETVSVKKLKPGSPGAGEEAPEVFVVEGAVSGAKPSDGSFTVRDVRVIFDSATQFEGGTAAGLDERPAVAVTGVLEDGKRLRARHIKING